MSTDPKTTENTADDLEGEAANKAKDIYSSMDSLAQQLGTFETFIARRFDEISMEINATSQQIDLNEEETTKRFGDIMEVLKAVSYKGDGGTAANAGVELSAVVDATENAANTILDAAERISERIKASQSTDNEEVKNNVLENIGQDIEDIFMACSFQDITGQRIRKTLDNLREIEDRLGTALAKIGIDIEADVQNVDAISGDLSSQGDVDAMFQVEKKTQEREAANTDGNKEASQDEIDDMF